MSIVAEYPGQREKRLGELLMKDQLTLTAIEALELYSYLTDQKMMQKVIKYLEDYHKDKQTWPINQQNQ